MQLQHIFVLCEVLILSFEFIIMEMLKCKKIDILKGNFYKLEQNAT